MLAPPRNVPRAFPRSEHTEYNKFPKDLHAVDLDSRLPDSVQCQRLRGEVAALGKPSAQSSRSILWKTGSVAESQLSL